MKIEVRKEYDDMQWLFKFLQLRARFKKNDDSGKFNIVYGAGGETARKQTWAAWT